MRWIAICLFLAGCNTVTVKTECLPLTPYTQAQQQALANAMVAAGLDDNSPIAQAIVDYERMRDEDRACLAKP